jgi:NADH-quinone oxidoreductase subunit N
MIPTTVPFTDWSMLLPIAMVAITGVFALILEMLYPKRDNSLIVWCSLIGLGLAAAMLIRQFGVEPETAFAGTVLRDQFGLSMQLIIVFGTAATILFSDAYLREKRIPFGEFYPLMLWSAMGAMLMCCTENLLVMFVGLEILSISLYVLAGISRKEEKGSESALKYFLLGSFATGFLLYGIANLYGATAGLELGGIAEAWRTGGETVRTLLAFGLALLLIGLGFKASFFPFHQWTPDVYQGAPTNVTAFMATVSKTAAFAFLYRLLGAATDMQAIWVPALGVVAVLTMLYGNIVALQQKDVKRVLAYSSISHAGYVLLALMAHGIAPDKVGPQTLVYYTLSYTFMTVGAFAVISLVARDGKEETTLDDLRGLWKTSRLAAACLVIFMVSLIGLPPTSGFIGKLLIFQDALATGLLPLAILLAVSSIISVTYYLQVAYQSSIAESSESTPPFANLRPTIQATCVICAVAVVAFVVFFSPLTAMLGSR